uniref:Uncharacterized protein n=1 Tax=Hyaloperonospora arabidopsidis (strain Emoy2) TaxID=559515 RepID=M4BXJ1_HYAAE
MTAAMITHVVASRGILGKWENGRYRGSGQEPRAPCVGQRPGDRMGHQYPPDN